MEMLSWMRKIDMTMDKLDLLDIIDHMHELIDTFLAESKEKDNVINELRDKLEKHLL